MVTTLQGLLYVVLLIDVFYSFVQETCWAQSPGQFVEDEDDESFSFSVRISAQDLLQVCRLSIFCLIIIGIYIRECLISEVLRYTVNIRVCIL